MKTDSIFYQIFLTLPQSFFDLIGEAPSQGENYQFTSREVKQLSFRLDGLFLPTEQESSLPLYLVEVQFQSDPDFYYRLFSEFFLFLKQYKPPHPWDFKPNFPVTFPSFLGDYLGRQHDPLLIKKPHHSSRVLPSDELPRGL